MCASFSAFAPALLPTHTHTHPIPASASLSETHSAWHTPYLTALPPTLLRCMCLISLQLCWSERLCPALFAKSGLALIGVWLPLVLLHWVNCNCNIARKDLSPHKRSHSQQNNPPSPHICMQMKPFFRLCSVSVCQFNKQHWKQLISSVINDICWV